MAMIQNIESCCQSEPLDQKQTSAVTGSFLIRHLMQAHFYRMFATCSPGFGSNFARLGLGTLAITDGTVRLLTVRLWPALSLFCDIPAANVFGDVLPSSSDVYSTAGEHDSSVAAIVTIQRTNAMCRTLFLGPAMSHI